jgi:tellurium resistance protein TerZ
MIAYNDDDEEEDDDDEEEDEEEDGEDGGDKEQITIDLEKLSPNVASLVFTVNKYYSPEEGQGDGLKNVKNAYCRLLDDDQQEIAIYRLGGDTYDNAMIMAKVYRENGEWNMKTIGELGNGPTYDSLVPLIIKHL